MDTLLCILIRFRTLGSLYEPIATRVQGDGPYGVRRGLKGSIPGRSTFLGPHAERQ